VGHILRDSSAAGGKSGCHRWVLGRVALLTILFLLDTDDAIGWQLWCVYRVLGVWPRRVCCVLHVLLLQRIVIVHYALCVPSAAQRRPWWGLAWANQF
jgi:hypothetical protein